MKKPSKPTIVDGRAKVKMTVFHFETESSNEALQENIKSLVAVVSKALSPQPKIITTLNSSKTQVRPLEEDEDAGIDEEDTDESSVESDSQEVDVEEAQPIKPKPKQIAKTRVPKPIEIDLTTGDKPLRSFLEEKKPDSDNKRYLAIAYWLKTFRDITEVSMDHAYTCYRHMGWQVPRDAGVPFRHMKSARYGWLKAGDQKGFFSVNHIGENEVEKMGKTE